MLAARHLTKLVQLLRKPTKLITSASLSSFFSSKTTGQTKLMNKTNL